MAAPGAERVDGFLQMFYRRFGLCVAESLNESFHLLISSAAKRWSLLAAQRHAGPLMHPKQQLEPTAMRAEKVNTRQDPCGTSDFNFQLNLQRYRN
jgi:hypothetical protein